MGIASARAAGHFVTVTRSYQLEFGKTPNVGAPP